MGTENRRKETTRHETIRQGCNSEQKKTGGLKRFWEHLKKKKAQQAGRHTLFVPIGKKF